MKVVFFANGGALALEPLRAVAARHDVVAVVRPADRRGRFRGWMGAAARAAGLRPTDPLVKWVRQSGLRELQYHVGGEAQLGGALRKCAPDIACISTFPSILPAGLLDIARLGTVNLHPSLLPRHRGRSPYFWIYYHDDQRTGVTVHRATARADAGPVLGQESFALARGMGIVALHEENARAGARVLMEVLDSAEAGRFTEAPQDDALATPAPRVAPGAAMVNFRDWEVERVWHFLAGLVPMFREPLRETGGRGVRYAAVQGFERGETEAAPGSVTRTAHGWSLHCRGGLVNLVAERS